VEGKKKGTRVSRNVGSLGRDAEKGMILWKKEDFWWQKGRNEKKDPT